MQRVRFDRCRVCGCTEDNACEGGCSWMTVSDHDAGGPMCTACPGTEGDLNEVMARVIRVLADHANHDHARFVLRSFRMRRRNYLALVAENERLQHFPPRQRKQTRK